MSFKRYVELGRVCMIQFGPDQGKLCTIIDVIDNNRIMVDGPETITGVHRQAISLKRVMLTDIKITVKLNASVKSLTKAFEEGGVMAKWEASPQAKKRTARGLRAATTDFERFQIMLAKKERSAKRSKA